MLKNLNKNLLVKVETKEDENFLFKLFSSTREDELSFHNILPKEKKIFLMQQFNARQKDFKIRYEDANFFIIKHKEKDVGRIVYKIAQKIQLIDIALISKSRNKGFGTYLIQTLMKKALETNLELHLSVATNNPKAFKLYRSLGFKIISQDMMYIQMAFNKNS